MTNLVIQSFGSENELKRAILTVLSFYAYNSLPIAQTKIILFTDNPDYFKAYLHEIPIQCILLTPEKIKQMRGRINFLHRMKIALIEESFNITEGDIIYADSDTFFISDPAPLLKELNSKKSYMHVREYAFESLRHAALPSGKTARAFLELLESNTFKLTNGINVKYSTDKFSWNAGAMMFHPAHAKFIPDVYTLTDQFYPATLSHASEQFAFSLILQSKTEVKPCDTMIYHYWYRVKKQIMDIFLAEHLNKAWAKKPLSEKLINVKEWCSIMPDYFAKHVLMVKDIAIQAFNEQRFLVGYSHSLKVLSKTPFDINFIKDVFYHIREHIK